MKRLLTITMMLAAATTAACENNDENGSVLGVPLPGASAIDIRIAGPDLLRENGEYRWTAEINGSSAENAEYRWDVLWPDTEVLAQTVTGPTLDLFVDANRQSTIELHLQVAADGRFGTTSVLVTICPLSPPQPVDDCGNIVPLEH